MTRSKSANPNYITEDSALGNFPRSFHLEMVQDGNRVNTIKRAIQTLGVRHGDGVFCELGSGSGLFSIEAAQHFKHVFAFEADEQILDFAKSAVKKAGYEHKVSFIHGDVEHSDIITEVPPISVLFAEMLSIWMIEEPQIKAVKNFRPRVRKDGAICPSKIVNLLSVGRYDYQIGGFELKAPSGEFALPNRPVIATETRIGNMFDMWCDHESIQRGRVELTALMDEELNCVILNSYVEFVTGINFSSSDSLMPTTVMPTLNVLSVKAGDTILVDYEFSFGSKLELASFSLRLAK